MKVYAIRHGLTEYNKKGIINGQIDDGLASEGREQARMASAFVPKTIQHIYSSTLKRAHETAELLNSELRVPITTHAELAEVHFGRYQGTEFTAEKKALHASQKYNWRDVGGESVEDVKERVLKILKQIAAESKDGEALIVTHGGIIRMLQLLEKSEAMHEIQNTSLHSFDLDAILARNK
jgi:broad specificity phosphatase PhoE